jgi:hypothetical protein
MVLLCCSAAASCKQVLLFYPQGMSYDYVSLVPGQLPAAANQKPQVAHGDADIEEGELDDSTDGPLAEGGSVRAPRAQHAQAAAAQAQRGPVKDPIEQLERMILRRERRWGNAEAKAIARSEANRLGLTNVKKDKTDYAAVFLARVGETKRPQGIVQNKQDGVETRCVSSSALVL